MSRITDPAELDGRLAAMLVAELIEQHGLEEAHRLIDEVLDGFSNVELAAHDYDWRKFWARPKQNPPMHADWESFGYLSGRGNGKTISTSKLVNEEVEAGRAPLVCLIAQDEDSSIKLHVTGPSGLIATAPPWFKPEWHATDKELHWPDGSIAYVRTPEVPGKIRGLEYHLAWCSEIQSWPASQMEEAWMNVLLSTRLGLARIIWDATAKKRHPILKQLLQDGKDDPRRCVVRRGSTYENALNLARGYIERIERKYPPHTRAGKEELFAVLFDDAEGATAQSAWIKKEARPARFVRKALGLDPAITDAKGSDTTGIVLVGGGFDGRACVLRNKSGKIPTEEWAKIALDVYVEENADVIMAETNKGGRLIVQSLRVAARDKDLEVVVLEKDERPRGQRGVVFVREVYARGAKSERAKPVGAAYEAGDIFHDEGEEELSSLENTLTTWVPTQGADSPGDLDALVHASVEVLELDVNAKPDRKKQMQGVVEANRRIHRPTRPNILSILGRGDHGGRI